MLTHPRLLYTGKSEAGALYEGRKDKWSGNTMTPSALLRYHMTRWIGLSQSKVEWSSKPMMEANYEIELKSYFPLSMIFDGTESVKRLETLSFWHLSFQEIVRHLERLEQVKQQSWYHELMELADSYKEQIIDAFKKYVSLIIEKGDMSFEQFTYYVKEHENSASPYDGKKWKDILTNPSWMKRAYVDINKWIIDFQKNLNLILSYKTPLIKVENVYPALRARQADYEVINSSNEILRVACRKTRDRKAGGVKGLSQIEYPIYHKEIKKSIYQECFYSLIQEISGCELIPIIMHGADFYKQIIAEKPNCYDLSNAEKLVGHILSYLPTNVDLGHPEYSIDIAGEMYSGIGPTRPLSEIVVAIIVKFLKIHFGIDIQKLFLGGDNFGIREDLDCKELEIDILMTKEDTILGIMPSSKHFGPLSLVTDNVDQRANIPLKWSTLTWTQQYQYELRPLQVIVDNDLYKPGSCERKIDWVVGSKELSEKEIYSKESLNKAIKSSDTLRERFYDMFSDELNFLKQFIPTHQNQNKSTDAHLSVVRRT